MKYTVEVTETAEAEFDAAYRWLRDQYSPEYAVRWREALVEAIGSLETFPERCALAPEARATTLVPTSAASCASAPQCIITV
jgi:plasmid stabilization system protein ParE